MTYITKIGSFIPAKFIDNKKQAQIFGRDEDFIESKIGSYYLPQKDASESCVDLGFNSIEKLFAKTPIKKEEIELLCLVTQNPADNGIPHSSSYLHSLLDLPKSCHTFDISLGCSGYVYGLSIVSSFMKSNNLKNAILITSDQYSNIIDSDDQNTSLLFGDAATASLVTNSPYENSFEIGNLTGFSDGKAGKSIYKNREGKLVMNGRAVFNFALKQVPQQIKEHLRKENLEEDDIDLFIMHQGSKAIVKSIARLFPSVSQKFLINIENTGNTISSSIPLLLEEHLENSDQKYKRILITGFGVGLSSATMILTKSNQ